VQRLSAEILAVSLARHAPAWLREAAPSGAASRQALLDVLGHTAPERLVLHTCERFELYLAGEAGEASSLFSPLASWLRVSPDVLASHVQVHRGDAVAEHLFRVAAGLESRRIGEPQIRGQLREAFAEAREARAVGPLLDALCRAALHTGRLVRRETALGRGASLVDLTLARLREDLTLLRGRSVLVAGTGRLAAEVVAALSGTGALVTVASRQFERAERLAVRFHAQALSHSDLSRALLRADALVTCSHGLLPIEVAAVAGRRLSVVDLGMPSNVPAPLAADPALRLTRLDDLTGAAAGPEIAKALAIVANEHEHFRRWRAERTALFLETLGRRSKAAA
jgi:glutamyl-tRNA reductase